MSTEIEEKADIALQETAMHEAVKVLFDVDVNSLQNKSNIVYRDFPESTTEEQELTPSNLVFMVQYLQDYNPTCSFGTDLHNLFFCPDESFEMDLDNNFKHALHMLEIMRVETLNKTNFLCRPGEEDPNQGAYDEDDAYGEESGGDGDLDIF